MPVYPEYFELTARKGIKGMGNITFKEVILIQAKELWEAGVDYFHITPQGAQKLYGDTTPEQRLALLTKCRTEEEVAAIKALKGSNKELNKAIKDRLQEFRDAIPPVTNPPAPLPEKAPRAKRVAPAPAGEQEEPPVAEGDQEQDPPEPPVQD